MKNLELNGLGVQEMNATEMREVDGGLVPLIIFAAAVLLSSCGNIVIGNNNTVNSTNKVDSTGNGNSAGTGSGNSVR